jgi:hypothetical protein
MEKNDSGGGTSRDLMNLSDYLPAGGHQENVSLFFFFQGLFYFTSFLSH